MPRASLVLTRCCSYNPEEVHSSVAGAIELLGGMGEFVAKGEKVLIKPNLISARLPEEGVTTHPEVVRAVIKLVKEYTSDISLGDSPGGIGKNTDEVYERSGMKRVAMEEGISLVKFDRARIIKGMPVALAVLEAERVISVPKFKTHANTILTCAIKNMFGIISGLYKANMHAVAPKAEDFAKKIVDVFSMRAPDLTVLDAVVAMEGNGPATGDLRKMGLIAAGSDAVSIDAVMAKIVGLDPFNVPIIKEAHDRGLGTAEMSDMDIIGLNLKDAVQADFKLPKAYGVYKKIPQPVLKAIISLIKFFPVINKKICKKCDMCHEICLAGAVDIAEYKIDRSKCILCLCCQEICPYKAIYIKRSVLAKIMSE